MAIVCIACCVAAWSGLEKSLIGWQYVSRRIEEKKVEIKKEKKVFKLA